ncbi:CsgG/HfaB family protein, partial [uncultured Pseudoalteromonas sp.]
MRSLILTTLIVILSGCSSMGNLIPPTKQLATTLEPTETFKTLQALPQPVGSIPVSVYSFRDQTGQYKPQANVSSFSTAVTQGANSILVQALHESDWFIPVEREGLQN